METPAFTDELALEVNRAQYEYGEGPCLQASSEGGVLRIEDVEAEPRWPRFAERAGSLGVGSMIACGLRAQPGFQAALNLHTQRPVVFNLAAAQTAEICAIHSSAALTKVAQAASLRLALVSRQRIGEATGILMERHRAGFDQCFEMLVRASQRLNVKLRVVAAYVVLTGQDPAAVTAEDLRSTALAPWWPTAGVT